MEPARTLQGRYEILSTLGRGGMGVVYLGRHTRLGMRVAIKEMQVPETADRDYAVRAFEREARLLAAAGAHPNLVRAMDCFEEGDRLYLVMEFVEGKDLLRVVNEAPGFLPVGRVLSWVDQVCDVLEYLHGLDPPIIYRDLKPANIMVEADGRVRLIDFGIARTFSPEKHTTTTIPAFSAGYSPLEQQAMGTVDQRADIYAMGATVYALLTRRIPPSAVDRVEGQVAVLRPSAFNPAVPPALDALVLHMMALRASERCAPVSEVRRRLREIVGGFEAAVPARFCCDCGAPLGADGRCARCLDHAAAVCSPAPPPALPQPVLPVPPPPAPPPPVSLPPRGSWALQAFLLLLIFLGVGSAVYFARAEHGTAPAASSSISVLGASPSAAPSGSGSAR